MLNKGLASEEPAELLPQPADARFRNDLSPSPTPSAGPPAADWSKVLDPGALAQLQQLDPSGENRFVERLLATFSRSADRLLPKLTEARRVGDEKTIKLVVHTFKSSSASIGALALAEICRRTEAAIMSTNGSEIGFGLDALTPALEMTLRAIAQRLDSSP